jgi:hypothetical protein
MRALTEIKIIAALLFIAWIFFPSTIIRTTYTKIFQEISPDMKYKVVVYRIKILSPMSLFKYIKDEDYFFIIYDSRGNKVFKPSPYYGTSEILAYDSIRFFYGEKHSLFYPGNEGYDSFELSK